MKNGGIHYPSYGGTQKERKKERKSYFCDLLLCLVLKVILVRVDLDSCKVVGPSDLLIYIDIGTVVIYFMYFGLFSCFCLFCGCRLVIRIQVLKETFCLKKTTFKSFVVDGLRGMLWFLAL